MNWTSNIAMGSTLLLWLDAWDIVLSIGIFLAVLLLVAAVFSQSGRVQRSPQREVALAMGHTDRRTVFELPLLRSFMWLLLGVSHRLAMPRLKEWVRRKLVAAGSPNYYTPEEYLAMALLSGTVLGLCLAALSFLIYAEFNLIVAAVGFAVGTALATYQLRREAAGRVRLIAKRVPYALDLIALAMGAGATFTEAVRTVVREEHDDPFNVELKAVLAETELGTTRRGALENLADRVPLDALRSIVASVIQAEELGTPLADVLRSQATLLRLDRSARAENAAAVASVRILIPSLLILISVVLVVFAPFILRGLQGGLF